MVDAGGPRHGPNFNQNPPARFNAPPTSAMQADIKTIASDRRCSRAHGNLDDNLGPSSSDKSSDPSGFN
jgi:hypothetical protein